MEMLLLFFVLAVVVEALVEYVKTVVSMDRQSIILQLSALAVSVLLCLLSGADIFNQLGITFALPYVGAFLPVFLRAEAQTMPLTLLVDCVVQKQNTDT